MDEITCKEGLPNGFPSKPETITPDNSTETLLDKQATLKKFLDDYESYFAH